MTKHNYGDVVLCTVVDKDYHQPVLRYLTERVLMRKQRNAWCAEIKTSRIPKSVLDGVSWQVDLVICDCGSPVAMGAFELIPPPPTTSVNPPTEIQTTTVNVEAL